MPLPKPKSEEHVSTVATAPVSPILESGFSGQRRLIRPNLSLHSTNERPAALYGHSSPLTTRSIAETTIEDSSHAEVFYFQKQIQAQTRMVVVLENGIELEGAIEWYDRYAIKLRNVGRGSGQNGTRTRVLIYKDSIRYIYKSEENLPQTMS